MATDYMKVADDLVSYIREGCTDHEDCVAVVATKLAEAADDEVVKLLTYLRKEADDSSVTYDSGRLTSQEVEIAKVAILALEEVIERIADRAHHKV